MFTTLEKYVFPAVIASFIIGTIGYVFYPLDYFKKKSGAMGLKSTRCPGLLNDGNTCYLNSALQSLASCQNFVAFCFAMKSYSPLAGKLSSIFSMLNTPSTDIVSAASVLQECSKRGWKHIYRENDVYELLQIIFELLSDEFTVNSLIDINGLTCHIPNFNNGVYTRAVQYCRDQVRVANIPNTHKLVFSGQLASRTRCTFCQATSDWRVETFNSISLPSLRLAHSLEMLVEEYFKPEFIDDLYCSTCTTNRRVQREHRLIKLPLCLCFQIQRTHWVPSGRSFKSDRHLLFQHVINLSLFCFYAKPDAIYVLKSVVEHRGNINHGHFISYRWLNEHRVWQFASDEHTNIVNWETVKNSSCYLLFYERISKPQINSRFYSYL